MMSLREITTDAVSCAVMVVVTAHGEQPDPKRLPDDVLTPELSAILQRKGETSKVISVDIDRGSWHTFVHVTCQVEDAADVRARGAQLARAISGNARVYWQLNSDTDLQAVRDAFYEGWWLGGYRYSLKSQPAENPGDLMVSVGDQPSEQTRNLVEAVALARTWVNTPANIATPEWITEQWVASMNGRPRHRNVSTTVMGEAELRKLSCGGMLAVSAGSQYSPRMLVTEISVDPQAPTVMLVGKGVMFDSGGLSLKPPSGMITMKTDMTGAAVVGGVASYLTGMREFLACNVVVLAPIVENMPSGGSYRPGDVITHADGTTSEIDNTDAEGRLILADAIAVGRQRYQPDIIVDVATLTGAATLALSRRVGAFFSNTDELAEDIMTASGASGEKIWRLPLVDEYRSALDSPIADIRQTASAAKIGAGAIAAALFLEHFVGSTPWVHMDIAGPGRAEKDYSDVTSGGTAFGVRLLAYWITHLVRSR